MALIAISSDASSCVEPFMLLYIMAAFHFLGKWPPATVHEVGGDTLRSVWPVQSDLALATSSVRRGALIQEMMIDTQIKQKTTKMLKAIGRLMKSMRLPCDLISVVIKFFSRMGPMTMPSTQGAIGNPFSSIR